MEIAVNVIEKFIPSTNGKDKLRLLIWEPVGRAIGILQISHGMQESVERYDDFAKFLATRGFIVCGNDHLGHGKTAATADDLGYMDADDPSAIMVKDLYRVTKYIRKERPYLPFFLMGHSMGSFLGRRYMSEYGKKVNPSGFICMGTGNSPKWLVGFGLLASKLVGAVKGDHHRSKLITTLAFGTYGKGIPKYTDVNGVRRQKTDKDWLTRDPAHVEKYMANPFCMYTFTVRGFKALFTTILYVTDKRNISKVPRNMPVLFVSGDQDPVGAYGKDVEKIYNIFKNSVTEDCTLIMYEGARHEILNELDYMSTYNDILKWLTDRIN